MTDLASYSFLVLLLIATTSGFQRNLESKGQVIDADLKRLATANNYLAVNIYRQLATDDTGNIFFSPLSLSTAFGMLYYGTRGRAAKELRKALGYERARLEEDSVHQTFKKYLTETLPSQDTRAYTLNTANAILLDKMLNTIPDYKTAVQDYYNSSVKDVDFFTEGLQVVSEINEWVREKTNGKVDELLVDLNPYSMIVLLNAIYFKGTWKKQFDPSETMPKYFHNNGQKFVTTKTPMMSLDRRLKYLETDDLQAIEMPYKGNNISMVIMLPRTLDGLDSVERNLNLKTFSRIRKMIYRTQVHVVLPKFKLEFWRELSQEFENVGARKVFTPGADFSGITSSDRAISVNQVMHKAVIEVNEGGTEAAAATAIAVGRSSHPFFNANHPFLFAIIDRRNDMILFMGRVTNL